MSCLIGIFFQYDASPKVTISGPPLYMVVKISTEHLRQTRQETSGYIRFGEEFSAYQNLTKKDFYHGASRDKGGRKSVNFQSC